MSLLRASLRGFPDLTRGRSLSLVTRRVTCRSISADRGGSEPVVRPPGPSRPCSQTQAAVQDPRPSKRQISYFSATVKARCMQMRCFCYCFYLFSEEKQIPTENKNGSSA